MLLLAGGIVFWRRRQKRALAEAQGFKDEEDKLPPTLPPGAPYAPMPLPDQRGPAGYPLGSGASDDPALFSMDSHSWSTLGSNAATTSRALSGMPPTPELGSGMSAVQPSQGNTVSGGTGVSSVPTPRSGASNRQEQIMAALLAGVWDINLAEVKLGKMIGKGSYGKVRWHACIAPNGIDATNQPTTFIRAWFNT